MFLCRAAILSCHCSSNPSIPGQLRHSVPPQFYNQFNPCGSDLRHRHFDICQRDFCIPSQLHRYQRRSFAIAMGRLRNLSASFKAAAFPTANTINQGSRSDENGPQENTKSASALTREPTANSDLTQADSFSTRPTSMMYTPPTIVSARGDEVEELKPVFRYAWLPGCQDSHNDSD